MDVGVQVVGGAPSRTGDAFDSDCPGRTILTHIAGRWGVLIIAALRDGPLRFYRLRDRIDGISEKMLAQNLRALTRDGLLRREVEDGAPPRVSYSLTAMGHELTVPLQGMLDWISVRADDIVAAQRRHDELHGGG
ncbi:DNA-binding HxlR family transcriptional regulator [Actinoalloteichus hoggarensis]|uniref:HTH-type transcriptional activator HxlR n=1 Tax=Actinoalloteichus hoggarensis TaxID=1470176 RepID=A0A221W2N5_9PSEU|nr:helix-turn-helix domain-containing protein [Actinoalloteichus hoggarensis]ASO20026.1 HTH-type transcriptional activator HxlR [Actinoalloteichus hoggarensis]MBB5919263.1 DNA-binding HxlR family transcriptional regulator [Actinoalloteichus hoggarensis]